MILVDAGPLVALFNVRDARHTDCKARLATLTPPLATTLPVLTEALYMLPSHTGGRRKLRAFLTSGGLGVHFSDDGELARALALMEVYADHPMDFADASIIAAAETLGTRRVFTVDRNDFQTYRIRRGHRQYPVEIV